MPTTTNYLWDDDNLPAEADGTNTINTVYTNEPQQYGNLVSTRASNTASYHHFDALGSTRQLTNAAGRVTDAVAYDAWGNAIARTGSTGAALLWIGELEYYFDKESGLHYVRARTFGPIIGRWTSADPIFPSTTGVPYVYSANRPLAFSDPSGLDEKPAGGKVNVPLPKNPKECYGFCFGTTATGGNLIFELADCKLTAVTQDPGNDFLCPGMGDAKTACKKLVDRLNQIQEKAAGKPKKDGKDNKGWGLNLCASCDCDWDNATWFRTAGQEITLTFAKTDIGETITSKLTGTFTCKYTLTGTISVKIKDGEIAYAGCKVKC